jgi:hypothetical protein
MQFKFTLIFFLAIFSWQYTLSQPLSPADSLHAIHYDIHINNIDFQANTITGTSTVLLTSLNRSVDVISLELINLEASNVWIDGAPVTGFSQTDSLLVIPLDTPLQSGDTIEVQADYSGAPFHEDWGGFHFSGEYAFNLGVGLSTVPHNLGKSWFPCVDNFTDRATYDVFCTLPENKVAVGGGLLTEVIDNGDGTNTWHWNIAQPIPTYLASLAVGDYALVHDVFNGEDRDIPIDIYVRPQDTNRVAGTFINLKEILAIYEDRMGPYPFDRVGYTGTALGSMEHAANIFIPHSFVSGSTTYESTIAHELTHMWMGDEVTCSTAQDMWINEGWATFFSMYYALALYGDENSYKLEMRAKHGGVLQYCHTIQGDGSYFPLNLIPQEYTYGMSAYDRGSTVCQALRFYLGDSLFFASLKNFIAGYAFQPVSSYDMRDFMTDFTGIDMSGFFDNFVMHSGTPQYSVDSFAVGMNKADLYDVTVFVKQKRHGPAFTGNGNIMEVMFLDDNWNKFNDTIHFNGHSGHSTKMVPFIPSVILVDPEEKMCDATTDNYKTIKATGNYTFDKTFFTLQVDAVSDSAFVQVTHNWASPDSLREPVPGLRLSDYRYWTIDGIFPENFSATGKFLYSNINYLDNTLLTSSSDTIIILYRKNSGEDWHEIDFQKVGPWNVGNIIVPDMQAGEYTLAVKEAGVGSYEPDLPKKNAIEVYPNPSSGNFVISINSKSDGIVGIVDESGKIIDSYKISPGCSKVNWAAAGHQSGTYLVKFIQENKSIEIKKLIYLP